MAAELQQTRPEANPAALGLICFGLTTVMLSLINAGLVPEGAMAVVLPLAFIYGGLMQIIAGILEAKAGNTFGMTAFVSYGAFWVWFALLLWLGGMKSLDLSQVGSGVDVALLLWGFFTLYMWIGTFKLNRALWWIFLTLWITYFLLGIGGLASVKSLSLAGGWVGLLCGVIAMYTSFALVTNSTFKRTVLPIG
ncbi:MAG TPA: acetate uptake transporter [Rhodanobacteraceae bacterium]|jgi:succinate-acetate transporter protein|nr:acetate uptake transporter [Rhodanobacteraceae bacterium]